MDMQEYEYLLYGKYTDFIEKSNLKGKVNVK